LLLQYLITQLTLNDAKGGIMTQTEAQTKLPTGKWVIDPVHSSVAFSIRHMIAARAKGRFNKFKGSFNIKDPIEESTIEVEIDAASVDTSNEQRDNHLRSPDFWCSSWSAHNKRQNTAGRFKRGAN
jgi:polyisoprenoid-binding protein YceI